jgi:hypothetical protein
MFQWSKKVVKSVTFNPEVADESLLAQVEIYLETQPDKTFSDKETNRLGAMEGQLLQLTQQVAQLAMMLNERHISVPTMEVVNHPTYAFRNSICFAAYNVLVINA